MAGVVVGVETNEITIKDPEEDLATDGEDPNNRRFVVSISLSPSDGVLAGKLGLGGWLTYL